MLRAVTIGVGVLAAGYGGYWFVAAQAAKSGAQALVDSLRADGVEVEYADLATRGFPSRIDTTVTDLALRDPESGVAWEAPWFQVFALSYRPNRIIAAWPPEQEIVLPGEVLTLGSTDMMASAHLGLSTDLPLDSATVQSGPLTVAAATGGWEAGAAHLLAAFRHAGDADYDLFAELTDIALPAPILAALDPLSTLPATVPVLRVEARLTFDRPVARGAAPRLEVLALQNAVLDWTETGIAVSGRLTPDAGGRAEGTLQVELRNWPLLVDLARNAALVSEDQAALLRGALAAAANGDVSLTAPVTFAGGAMSIGPLPLGPAPLLPFAQ